MIKHYVGALGVFEYDDEQFALVDCTSNFMIPWGSEKQKRLKYIGTELRGDRIKIPDGIKYLEYTFEGTKITSGPRIPESVEECWGIYRDCWHMVSAWNKVDWLNNCLRCLRLVQEQYDKEGLDGSSAKAFHVWLKRADTPISTANSLFVDLLHGDITKRGYVGRWTDVVDCARTWVSKRVLCECYGSLSSEDLKEMFEALWRTVTALDAFWVLPEYDDPDSTMFGFYEHQSIIDPQVYPVLTETIKLFSENEDAIHDGTFVYEAAKLNGLYDDLCKLSKEYCGGVVERHCLSKDLYQKLESKIAENSTSCAEMDAF